MRMKTEKDNGIFISQDKYVADILKKFDFVTIKTVSTPIETNKALLKDEAAEDVDVHFYRSMIRLLMYLTTSRPDIMFVVCACARFQVTPKVSHLHAVKRIFRYLKGQPKLGLWYPRDSPFDLEAFSDSDYAGASLDRKSTTGGCQFLGKRLISWQCKKQTIVANSTTEVEYVVAANCCGQVLWIQNQMLDYGFNFMNTKIHIDNESTICIVKNLVFHSKTKHIEIRHHFIRDSYEKRLIQVIKIHTDHNVADLLTKAFDVSSDEFGVKTGSCKVNAARILIITQSLMANLEFCDKHNMVAYLKKPTRSEGFQEIAATVRTVDNGEQEITATVDGKEFTITKASVRRHLQLADVEGQVYAVAPSYPQKTQTPRQAKRGRDTEIPQFGGPPKKVGDEAVHKELGDKVERATITAASLDAEQDSGNIFKTQSIAIPNVPLSQEIASYDSPLLGGNTPGSDEERLEQHELTDNLPPTPHDSPLPGEGLESNLKKIKKLYSTEFKKLINRVKSLEDELKFQKSKSKRRRLTLVTSKDEEDLVIEDLFKQGRSLIEEMDLDAGISLVPPHMLNGMILARVALDEDFVQQLQVGEKCSEEDLPMKLVELVNQRKKFFAQQRAEAKRNKPMTPAQQKDSSLLNKELKLRGTSQ
ncbi:hypothetical protein Tco_1265200 [Tanacetum coccineum]